MDRPFVYIPNDEGPLLINLLQIVMTTSPKGKEDEITVHFSNGDFRTFRGERLVLSVVGLLQQYAIDLHGKILPIANLDDEIAKLSREQEGDATSHK